MDEEEKTGASSGVPQRTDGVEPGGSSGVPQRTDDVEPSRSVCTIVVNGREHRHAGDSIRRSELARLAYPDLSVEGGRSLTVAYRDGPEQNPRGVVPHDGLVRVANGQAFNVSLTDKS